MAYVWPRKLIRVHETIFCPFALTWICHRDCRIYDAQRFHVVGGPSHSAI